MPAPPRKRPAASAAPLAAPRAAPLAAPDRWDAFAITAPGLSGLVASELLALGITPRETSDAGVSFDATGEALFRANLWSRVASRVVVRLAQFEARDFATLERLAERVPWSRVLADEPGRAAALRVTCRKSRLYHSDAVAERVGRGIERALRNVRVVGAAGDDDDEAGDEGAAADSPQRIVVRFDHDVCTISADSSGALLHRRGWRQAVARAPLRETLAAAMLAACEWTPDMPLVDPFCGSGTVGIEAALMARNIAPGVDRAFAMERWPGIDPAALARVRDEARAAVRPSSGVPIVMRDRDAGAIVAARANAERAGVLADLTIEEGALSETDLTAIAPGGAVVTNPPYGVRVSEGSDLRPLYARLGDVVRSAGRGWGVALLHPDPRVAGVARLRFDTILRTVNGGIPVHLLRSRP